MKGLFDTHTFMWWDASSAKLSPAAIAFIRDPANTLLLSVVSVWEIVIKNRLGKLSMNRPLQDVVSQQRANGIQIVPIALEHVLTLETFPTPHKDPFDRILAAQANVEGAVLLSADPIFAQYPVNVLW
jgi:PIN domain nuclease of toxin-antitoxin system